VIVQWGEIYIQAGTIHSHDTSLQLSKLPAS